MLLGFLRLVWDLKEVVLAVLMLIGIVALARKALQSMRGESNSGVKQRELPPGRRGSVTQVLPEAYKSAPAPREEIQAGRPSQAGQSSPLTRMANNRMLTFELKVKIIKGYCSRKGLKMNTEDYDVAWFVPVDKTVDADRYITLHRNGDQEILAVYDAEESRFIDI